MLKYISFSQQKHSHPLPIFSGLKKYMSRWAKCNYFSYEMALESEILETRLGELLKAWIIPAM